MLILSGARGSTGEEGTHKYEKKKLEQDLAGAHWTRRSQREHTTSTHSSACVCPCLYPHAYLS